MLRTHDEGELCPARRCWCGIHVCPSPDSLRPLLHIADHFDVVMGEVEYAGRVLPRNRFAGDPPGTVRVERARLLRLDLRHLHPDKHKAAAAALRHYGVP